MKIIDKDGKSIEITDLEAAIKQAEMFSQYKISEKASAFLKGRQAYWKDMLRKLKQLKEEN
ncbi:hypothetical protein [Echinicola vietnamensis]|uniref:Uncharacterized protein n=1 Tax=Echinicola vietnamensis (strain DSM 17526 / LMG 23754 / KMM 6221) TaxID=926556 RepID=L0G6A1_ECHVK|nr:hypothetical protein [Echinicola vietnamensis]AGA80296.1 hypothetical protein Echvi_4089 [Echinicola vietnamensis DSM 17526]AGA80380.1 hypothetical protein Echvi_4182 [Echinicola vietnamensis DSM 17526]